MPAPQLFADAWQKYLTDARAARDENKAEAHRRGLFLHFVTQAFGVDTSEITLEQSVDISLASVKTKGYIDALFRDLIFEFKRDIAREPDKARSQLEGYLRSLKYGQEHVGLLTDGLRFETYVLDGETLRQTDTFDLEKADAEGAFLWLDSYLFSQKNTPPTSADIVRRFGANSPVFQAAFRALRDLLHKVDSDPALAVWRGQWRKLLSMVYGTDVGDDDLFIRHTYLCQFARLLAYSSLKSIPRDKEIISQVVNGQAFYGFGITNLGENDFFSWILMPDVRDAAMSVLRQLADGLVVYDLTRINQDLLKQLYQNLVDPATRHELGEYYTPDWLAELTLQEINYQHPQRLLDPACGSGSFLFNAIKRLESQGLKGPELARFAVDNIVGVDVHPLAVTIARINYLLALVNHIPGSGLGMFPLPVYMANALNMPENNKHEDVLKVVVDAERDEEFVVPLAATRAPKTLTEMFEQMRMYAELMAKDWAMAEQLADTFQKLVSKRYSAVIPAGVAEDLTLSYWGHNIRLLTRLMKEERNGIWTYILKNVGPPLAFEQNRFDVIVGNPPWLSYRFIQNRDYQAQVKKLYQGYGLIGKGESKLVTQMDLSSLFFAHSRERYLKPGGAIAFVMPRAVITGAKQHRRFQQQGFTRIIDLLGVEPLFNVPSCVLIRQGNTVVQENVPAVAYSGKLKVHELSLAETGMTHRETMVRFVDSEVRGSHYYDQFKEGATLVPRTLCFIHPLGSYSEGGMETDPDAAREAKKPWKDVRIDGGVENPFVYATLLSKHLLPFGWQRLHLVALPTQINKDGALEMLEGPLDFAEAGALVTYTWFERAFGKWNELKKQTSNMSLVGRFNYQNLLASQKPRDAIRVIYNASGTHISACVMDTNGQPPKVYERWTQGFIVDYTTFTFAASSSGEAHYLCALLNAPCVDEAIKVYQPRGIYHGERHVQRTPFEATAIAAFDAANADHLELARLSKEAHTAILALKNAGGVSGNVYAIRRQARAAVQPQIEAIDKIASRLLGL